MMQFLFRRLALPSSFTLAILLAGCGMFSHQPEPAPAAAAPSRDLVAAIRAAGAEDNSIIAVNPLRDPAVVVLVDTAQRAEQAGNYVVAASELDQALTITPDAPDLLQDRAEIAVRLKDFVNAERMAHKSWSLGPRLGSLCARNWQTVVEIRQQADDKSGTEAAKKGVAQCRKPGIPRY